MHRFVERVIPAGWRMAAAWNYRAWRNARFYIADYRASWKGREEEFFLSGGYDTDEFLRDAGWSGTENSTLLEIGCGIGRMTRHLSARFGQVTAIDVSRAMIREARKLNSHLTNVQFCVNSGVDLRGFRDGEFDYVMSYIVFQHIPDPAIIYNYISEALRVLKPGGRFRFQARNDYAHWEADTYDGASVEIERVQEVVEHCACKMLNIRGEGTHRLFVEVEKAVG
jgi:SAM-dependent methyltransferase